MTSAPLMSLKNVGFSIPGMEMPILDNIEFTVFPGESLVLLGSNGSGKSSLMKLISRTLPVSMGEIEFKQKPLKAWKNAEFSKEVVCLAQDPAQSLFFDLSVLENCVLWELRFKLQRTAVSFRKERVFYSNYLKDYHAALPSRLDTRVALLSGGEKQALLLALSVYEPPQLLLLDEHTASLDPHQSEYMMDCTAKMIKTQGIASIMTTHNLQHALQFGDKLIAIKNGKIVFKAEKEEKKSLTRESLLKYCY